MWPNPDCSTDPGTAGRVAYAAYDAVGVLAALLCVPAAPYLLWRGYGTNCGERLGRLPAALRSLPARPVWIHAASVGETRAVAPLVARVRAGAPGLPIVVSTTSTTGRGVAARELTPDAVTLLPVDALGIADRVVGAVRPRCLVLVETEIWPNLLRGAARRAVPVVLVSGRISARAFARYRLVRPLLRAALAHVARFGMQTAADAERIVTLGAPAERVEVTGSLKGAGVAAGDGEPPLGGLTGRPVLVAASTQPGEEEFVLAACAELWAAHPSLLLVMAPRRPERFTAAAQAIERMGLRLCRRSAGDGAVGADMQVLLLDTVGELVRFLPLGVGVFVGGTIAALGGHNVLEPAGFGRPVAFGPHVQNVADAAGALRDAGGGMMVREPAELARLWRRLLDEPETAREMGARARTVATADAAVVERTWALLAPHLAPHGDGDVT